MEEKKGSTMFTIFKTCFSRKLLLIIITLVFAITAILSFEFLINKGNKVYTAKFEYSLNTLNNGRYVSGSIFNSKDLISLDTLESVKENNEEFASIDVETLSLDLKTSISETYETIEVNDGTVDKKQKKFFVLKLPTTYFESETQARKFMVELINKPIKDNVSTLEKMNLLTNIDLFDNALTYKSQISYLLNQYNMLINTYDSMLKTHGEYVLEDGTFISDKKKKVLNTFNEGLVFEGLSSELNNAGYIKDKSCVEDLSRKVELINSEIESLKARRTAIVEQMNNLIDLSQGGSDLDLNEYNKEIILLTNQILDKEEELKYVKGQQTLPDSTLFESKLSKYRELLVKLTNELSKTRMEILKTDSKVYYESASIINVTGGKNIIMMSVLFLVGGIVLGMCVNLALDYKKAFPSKKEEELISE